MLTIYAGPNARERISDGAIKADDFTVFLGASGGPKWFSLFGLDKYMFGEFFADRQQPLHMIGSSAGAFRAACFAQSDPVAAIKRLAKHYSTTTYSDKPTPQEITDSAKALLDIVVPENQIEAIIHNPVFKAHFIVARTLGLAASETSIVQMAGLMRSYLVNRVSRRLLKDQYQRFVFQSPSSALAFKDDMGFATQSVAFTTNNLKPALLASGSIPMVMKGIADIPDAPKGMYRDGGIIDYHFDLDIDTQGGLILYPHFNASPRAGWFDKSLPRKVREKNYTNTVMLVPSAEFVASLPYGKIPDREDFTKMDSEQRIAYWRTVLTETERLAESFDKTINNVGATKILPIDSI
ncbi:patatin-like phospholipase family protein [Alteromonas sp. ASW11-36]|uniref:Patatin-like phospholipase family protein n=1 Tax=Alteromonas arenosi TaxID=3055817 RepID=A0ABT7SY90_9ALTE|nr:patatin-like phospholipase family protein [Alteromonas sp. ASW11-36]MDM7861162.1 patatin-like phospholipase family protein [Alteromonas sp. ASW11-36]